MCSRRVITKLPLSHVTQYLLTPKGFPHRAMINYNSQLCSLFCCVVFLKWGVGVRGGGKGACRSSKIPVRCSYIFLPCIIQRYRESVTSLIRIKQNKNNPGILNHSPPRGTHTLLGSLRSFDTHWDCVTEEPSMLASAADRHTWSGN